MNKIKITTVKLSTPLKGFLDTADIKKPECADIYISSTTGELKTWKHKEPGKNLKVVLRTVPTINIGDLPESLLIISKGCSTTYLNERGLLINKPELSGRWQANIWRNCPFKKGQVKIEVKCFGRGRTILQIATPFSDARDVDDWTNVAQFRVTDLCDGVWYEHDKESPCAPSSPFDPCTEREYSTPKKTRRW